MHQNISYHTSCSDTRSFESMPLFTIEQLFIIQNEIYHRIQLDAHKLLLLKESQGSVMEKWQKLLQIILPIQMDVLQTPHLENGLTQFNAAYARSLPESPALRDLNTRKWLFIFEKAFGITEFKEISLQQAQSLIAEIATEMASEVFLAQIDNTIASLSPDASLIEKRQAILTVLFPLHLSVMARYGFEGMTGYIQAQRAIMDYYHDPLIAQKASEAQSIVFRRAKIS
jgi:hypothetical protein